MVTFHVNILNWVNMLPYFHWKMPLILEIKLSFLLNKELKNVKCFLKTILFFDNVLSLFKNIIWEGI